MTADGVIPPREDRRTLEYVGSVMAHHAAVVEFVVSGSAVRLSITGGPAYLSKQEREQFMRLWCEAERQAEGDVPP